ncbi:MAG TPA: flavin-dependent oxidoreductase, partial [Vineibacter sp.]|nr:flavin-dependent oxidoreductase [Vineibacter sp.]
VRCRVFEAADQIRPVGVGINLLPHAVKELTELGLQAALAKVAVTTQEAVFFNRFGQLIYREPLGRAAGYAWPQFSIHRGDLQAVLLDAFHARIGTDRLHLGWRCVGAAQDERGVSVRFRRAGDDADLPAQRGAAVIACDGIHSVLRKQLYPDEGDPLYSGYNMWRGVTRWKPFLLGASLVRAGWLATGKMVIYPIRESIDADGRQLVNWVAELETPHYKKRDWNRPGSLDDFIGAVADWHFTWLDVPAFLRAADVVLEFPMVDQDPLPRWSFGRMTLLGDAAHPMVPRGSNGAGQAILDARALAEALAAQTDPAAALQAYEAQRREVTSNIVLTNRKNPPDAILREVYLRTGDRPFGRIEDVIAPEELAALSDGYKRISGSSKEAMAAQAQQ